MSKPATPFKKSNYFVIDDSGVRIIGAGSAGVSEQVATGLGARIRDAFGSKGKHVKIRGMRFIPASKIDLGTGSFQVLANTIVEIAGRPQAFDSVVTVKGGRGKRQELESASIPPIDRP